ncbi:MAG: glycine zipper family protein [Proteobacteria bacterium]|nr:glycine zipper family protein [Pseudomonadota bacterium]
MSHSFKLLFLLVSTTTLSACTSFPTGPGMLVLPGTGKSFDQFRFDDVDCRQYASAQIGGKTASDAAIDSGVKSAVIGTAVGAAAGALIGGRNSAGVGAGSGLLMGSMVGAGTAESSGRILQQRYDFGYQQCMYAKGHRIPVSGRIDHSQQPVARTSYTPAPTNYLSSTPVSTPMPPPPPGNPPPPPNQ